MKPTDLHLFRSLGRPAPAPDGEVFVALSTPDLAKDRYQGVIWRVRGGAEPVEFTHGPRDSAPVLSPDGETLVFLRAGESGPAQPYAMPRAGGEPRKLAEHPLGVSGVVFSPDGSRIAYLAALPEPGRYGTARSGAAGDESASDPTGASGPTVSHGTTVSPGSTDGQDKPGPEAEPPRRLTRMSYRADGKGFLVDKPEQIFVLDLAEGARPRQLTAETEAPSSPTFTSDGTQLVYVRRSAPDALTDDVVAIAADAEEPGAGRLVARHGGGAGSPTVAGDTVYYVGTSYQGTDFAGRCPGLWVVSLAGGEPRRLTDPGTVHVDAMAGEPAVVGDRVLVAVDDQGAVGIRAVPRSAEQAELATLPEVVGGPRVVKSFTVTGSRLAAVVATPESTGDVVAVTLAAAGEPSVATPDAPAITDVSAALRAAGLARQVELSGSAPDGYPVHGWLVLPPGQGPHPVLLAVHGGPHAAYGWGIFDEAQMYAAHGYAVVLGNPRGSAGYGEQHGRAIVGALGTVDVVDLLALLDVALAREDCNGERVGVMGGSYGGFMTSWLAAHAPGRFVAAISERAVNAWDSFAGSSDIGYFFAAGYVGADRDAQWTASPLAYADRIGIPFLVMHSEQDWRCPIEQGQRLFVALKLRGHETEMLVFPGEGHELSRSGRPQHRRQRFEAILSWWDRYLPVTVG
jgi:dipeptidyl aminopeptidase/acylaminoacyl peptidase